MIPTARSGSCQTCASYRLEIFELRHAAAHETRSAGSRRAAEAEPETVEQVPAQSPWRDRPLHELARRAEEALAQHRSERHAERPVRQEAGALDQG